MKLSPHNSITREVRRLTVLIALVAVLVTGTVFLGVISRSATTVIKRQTALADTVSDDVSVAVYDQLAQSYTRLAEAKAGTVTSFFKGYTDDVATASSMVTCCLTDGRFSGVPVPFADEAVPGEKTMTLYLDDPTADTSAIDAEIQAAGCVEPYFYSYMEDDRYNEVCSMAYISKSGFCLVYDDVADALSAGLELTRRTPDYYKNLECSNTDIVIISGHSDKYGRGMVMTLTAPVFSTNSPDETDVAGWVVTDFYISSMGSYSLYADLDDPRAFTMLFSDGMILVKSDDISGDLTDERWTGYFPLSSTDRERVLSGESGLYGLENGDYAAFAQAGDGLELYVGIYIPEALITTSPNAARDSVIENSGNVQENTRRGIIILDIILLCVLAAVLVAVYFISALFVKRITAPIVRLTADVEIISGGDLDHRTAVSSDDEMGILAQSFNNMAQSLTEYMNNIQSIAAENERISTELELAAKIQLSMLPEVTDEYRSDGRFDIAASMDPAKEVGGDFYDFFMVDENHLAIVVADVSGKGVPAALFMAVGKQLIQEATVPGVPLGDVFTRVNDKLCANNDNGLFITAFEAVIDLNTGETEYANAGHELPFLAKKDGSFEALPMKHGFVLAGMEGVKYKSSFITLDPGEVLFQYTDGITEATNASQELYGMDRLGACLNSMSSRQPADILTAVTDDVWAFVGDAPQFDDMTMLAFRRSESA